MIILNTCDCKYNCTLLAFIASLIIGIVTAFLRITGVITIGTAFLWVTFGIAVAYLALTLIAAVFIRNGGEGCIRRTLSALLLGALLSVLFSVVLLAIPFVATSIVGAIITGLLLFSFSLTLTTSTCLTKCLVGIED